MQPYVAAAFVLALSCTHLEAATVRHSAPDRGHRAEESRTQRLRLSDVNDVDGKGSDDAPLNARERQKACAAQWRGFSAAEKTAQGPKWPQFYNRCIKRLKALKS